MTFFPLQQCSFCCSVDFSELIFLPYLLLYRDSFLLLFYVVFPVALICFATSLVENGGTPCDLLSFCCSVCFVGLIFAALLLLYMHPFLSAMLSFCITTIKVCLLEGFCMLLKLVDATNKR